MNKEPVDIDRFLPYGEMLRGFLEQPFLTKVDLSDLLRQRGIFVNPNEKPETIPWLMCTLLSPDEFDILRESQSIKEDNLKINTQTIPWAAKETLLDGLPDNFEINSVLNLEFSNFTVVGSPNFVPIEDSTDHLLLEFEIERNDFSKNWARTQSSFKGSLELQRVNDGNEVKLVVTHTANETKYVATKAAQGLIRHFKEKGHIEESSNISRILYGSFENADRISFFMALTRDVCSSMLIFQDVVDIEFSPDSSSQLPVGMEWMQSRIDDLKVNGKGLHETFFITNNACHSFVSLYHMVTSYEFDYNGLKGICVISAGFPVNGRDGEAQAEFEVNVKSLKFQTAPKDISKAEIYKIILREFDRLKLDSLAKLKERSQHS
jgi:hypothetical protein